LSAASQMDRRGVGAFVPGHGALALAADLDTVALTAAQWGICLIGPIVYLAITELGKWLERHSGEGRPAPATAET
jgi:hypothetical protein